MRIVEILSEAGDDPREPAELRIARQDLGYLAREIRDAKMTGEDQDTINDLRNQYKELEDKIDSMVKQLEAKRGLDEE